MGFSLSWIAVRGRSPEDVLATLELRPTGERSEHLPTRRVPFCWAKLGDWVLVLSDSSSPWFGKRFVDESSAAERFLAELSRGCEVVACFVEEHVMYTRAAAWKDGVRRWSVAHASEQGIAHLQVEGEPPASFRTLAADARAAQAADDEVDHVFEVPLNLARDVTDFRHDGGNLVFDVLTLAPERKPTQGPRRSFLDRILGRR